jgi:hypothetical protein
MSNDKELLACTPHPLDTGGFNPDAVIPHGLKPEHVRAAMEEFLDFLGFINGQLRTRDIQRFESMLMPANFSSMVGEFMISSIPKHCPTIVKNGYHNGHPDLIPAGRFPKDAVQHADEGVEVKSSRYLRGWQGHNAEDTWLMVFVFESSRPNDATTNTEPRPFRFVKVVGAELQKSDWTFSGRSETSRRTITASVNRTGFEKMEANWIYHDRELLKSPRVAAPETAPGEPLSEAAIEVES